MFLKEQDQRNIFEEKWSFVDFLSYDEEKNGIFIQVDGSLGRVWKMSFIEAEVLSSKELENVVNDLSVFLSRLYENVACQIILRTKRKGDRKKEYYQQVLKAKEDVISDFVTQAKVKNLEAREIDIFLTVRMFVEKDIVDKKQQKKNDIEIYIRKSEFLTLIQMIENHFLEMKVCWEVVKERQMIELLYEILNPYRAKQMGPVLNSMLPIREQVLYHAPQAFGDGVILERMHTRVVTIKDLPQQTFSGMFSVSSSSHVSLLDIHKDFLLIFNLSVPDQNKEIEKIKFQKAFAFLQRKSSSGDISEEAEIKKNELGEAIADLFCGGKAIVYARVHMILFGETKEDVEKTTDIAIGLLYRLGVGALKEDIIATSLFLSCLPLNFDPKFEIFIRRSRRIFSDNVAEMLPFYGAFQGTKTPASIYLNRKKEAVFLDLFDTSTNPHAIILGASGAGKSFFTNDFIFQNYRLGGNFFVLDKGHSYQKICSILDGQYITFDLNQPITINPFALKPTAEQLAFLMDVLALMASGADERDRLTREEKGILQMAVMYVYEKYVDREVFLHDVVDVLKDALFMKEKGIDEKTSYRLALRLAPWTNQGQYGGFFDGPNQFKFNKRFTVFELNSLSGYPDLQAVVLLNVMFFITQFVGQHDMRKERKYLLIDEAWQLLKTTNTAEFIANAFKTFRKYRCSAVAITQEVFDLLRQECGMALLANSANKIFLKQEISMIERIQKELNLSLEIKEILKSIKIVKGQYSEALVLTSTSSGVLQLYPDPFLYWASTSDAKENDFLDECCRHKQQSLLESIIACAKEFPHGLYE